MNYKNYFKKYLSVFCASMALLGAGSAAAEPVFFIDNDTPELRMSVENEFLEVDFTITNNFTTFGPNDVLTVSHLPVGVRPVFEGEFDDSSAYCRITHEHNGVYYIAFEQLSEKYDNCLIRFVVEKERATFNQGVLKIDPKVCANNAYCSSAGNQQIHVYLDDRAFAAPRAPSNIALIESSSIIFEVEAQLASCNATPHNYTCYELKIDIPHIYRDLVFETTSFGCALVNTNVICSAELTVEDEFKAEDFEFIRSPAVAPVYITKDAERYSGDTTIKLWWNGVELKKGYEQHLQYQSLLALQNPEYPGLVHLEDVTVEGAGDTIVFCDYDGVVCDYQYRTTCKLEENIGDDECKVWFGAIETDSSVLGSGENSLDVTLAETDDFNILEVLYEKDFNANSKIDLYAGVAFPDLFTDQFRSSVVKFDGESWFPVEFAPDGSIYALVNWKGDLIAGGKFGCSGDFCAKEFFPANNVARYDGRMWNSLGRGPLNGTSGPVYALADGGQTLYLGGSFLRAGYNFVYNLASWNNDDWDDVGGGAYYEACDPFEDCGAAVYSLQFIPGDETTDCLYFDIHGDDQLVAGGLFDSVGGNEADYAAADNIAVYDVEDVYWENFEDINGNEGLDGPAYALAWPSPTNPCGLFIGGEFDTTEEISETSPVAFNNVVMFDTTDDGAWDPLNDTYGGNGTNGRVNSIWIDENLGTVLVGGTFYEAGFDGTAPVNVNNIAQWNPIVPGWSGLDGDPSGPLGTVYALTQLQDVYLGGLFNSVSGTNTGVLANVNNVAAWNSSTPIFTNLDDGVPTSGYVSSLLVMPSMHIEGGY